MVKGKRTELSNSTGARIELTLRYSLPSTILVVRYTDGAGDIDAIEGKYVHIIQRRGLSGFFH